MNPIFPPNLKSKSLSRQVIEAIKDSIAQGELRPGDTLPTETELTERLGVSKSSVREAVKMLEAIGIVEIKRGQGTVLSETCEQGYMNVILFQLLMRNGSARELKEFRRMVETAYISMAIENADQKDLERIGASVERFGQSIRSGTVDVWEDVEFHRAVLRATHNSFIYSLGEAVTMLYFETIEKSIQLHPEHALRDHQQIYLAIKERNAEFAKDCVAHSLDMWADVLTDRPSAEKR